MRGRPLGVAVVLVGLAAGGCATQLSDVPADHGGFPGGLIIVVGAPPTFLASAVAAAPVCVWAEDRDCCFKRACEPGWTVLVYTAKLLDFLTSPGIWWTALKGGDWLGPDPWSLRLFDQFECVEEGAPLPARASDAAPREDSPSE